MGQTDCSSLGNEFTSVDNIFMFLLKFNSLGLKYHAF
jgi:hypothetical protein